MAAITTSLKNVPSKRELRLHEQTMEAQMQQVAEMNKGFTTAMERFKVSHSSPYDVMRFLTVAGPH